MQERESVRSKVGSVKRQLNWQTSGETDQKKEKSIRNAMIRKPCCHVVKMKG